MTKIDESFSLNLRETELCLGLPGGTEGETALKSSGKRGFDETVDLKLGIIQSEEPLVDRIEKKMMNNNSTEEKNLLSCTKDPTKPPLKAQVVGWPPVRSFRKNIMSQKASDCMNNGSEEKNDNSAATNTTTNNGSNSSNGRGGGFVKVSMDGAPYLRKVDLKMHNSYQQLSQALAQMFSSFTMGNYGTQGTIDFMIEGKLMDLLNSSEYVPTYEDKDSDWMLVGDVPWQMFVDSCKRLRIMKGSEAIGLAPRAMEKCKSRS